MSLYRSTQIWPHAMMSLHSQHYPRSSGSDDQSCQSHGVWVCLCVCTQAEWTGIERGGLVRL